MTYPNFPKNRMTPFLFFLWLFLPTSTAFALDIPLSFEAGYSYSALNKSEYKAANGPWITAAAHFRYLSLEAGYQNLGKFDLENVSDTHIDVSGYTVGVFRRFHLNDRLSIDPQLGLYAWTAEATFLDRKVGDDRGSSLWLGVAAHFNVAKIFGVFLSWQWFSDISKANINTLTLGLSLNF